MQELVAPESTEDTESEERLCALCDRPITNPRQLVNCSRACTVRAADLRRHGKEPRQPGYTPAVKGAVLREIEARLRAKARRETGETRDRLTQAAALVRSCLPGKAKRGNP